MSTLTSPIEKDGSFPTYLTLAGSAELLGTRRPVKVGGTVDGHPFTATLMPSGDTSRLEAEIREQADVLAARTQVSWEPAERAAAILRREDVDHLLIDRRGADETSRFRP